MSNWQKISFVLLALLLLSCLSLAGIGVWWVTSAGGANALAAMTSSIPTAAPTVIPAPGQQTPQGGLIPAVVSGRGLPGAGTFGIVSEVNGSTITVSGAKGASRILTIGNGTRIIVVGVPNATVGDIKPGDKILVLGVRRGADSLEPSAVIATPADYTRANVVVGQLQSVSGQSLTLQTAAGALTAVLEGDSLIYGQALLPAQASDLVIGRYVIVIGQPQSDGTLNAQLVLARTGGTGVPQPNRFPPTSTSQPTP